MIKSQNSTHKTSRNYIPQILHKIKTKKQNPTFMKLHTPQIPDSKSIEPKFNRHYVNEHQTE